MGAGFAEALSHPALGHFLIAALAAGLVRGFCGFGAALLFVPVAARFEAPVSVIVLLIMMDLLGPLPVIARAWREAERVRPMRMALGGAFGVPIGLWALTQADPTAFRWVSSSLAFLLLLALISGWRYRGQPGPRFDLGVGGVSGLMGGFSGLAGPPVILFFLGGPDEATRIRANIILFFFFMEFVSITNFAARGLLATEMVVLGLLLALPYTAAIVAGAALFRWRGDAFFRAVAYLLIAVAALSGLPLFDGML